MSRRALALAASLAATGCHHHIARAPVAAATPLPPSPSPTPSLLTGGLQRTFDQTLGSGWQDVKTAVGGASRRMVTAVDSIGETDERALGQATAIDIIGQGGGLVLGDQAFVRYVNRVGNLVAQQGHRRALKSDGTPRMIRRDFVFGVLDDDSTLNAFSTPGGYVFVTSGLVKSLGSESELAWVLGHEIAHVDCEHGLQALKIYAKQRAVEQILDGPNAPAIDWQDPGFLGWMAAKSADLSKHLFGRDEERLADSIGLEYSVAAGYDARAPGRVLDMFGDASPTQLSPVATHDPPHARAVALEDEVARLEAAPGYHGRIGASRFLHEGLERLDAARFATGR